jgi:hypothetical protein
MVLILIIKHTYKVWYKNSKEKINHREDGPAYINTDGRIEWWFEGEKHREDGPAVFYKKLDIKKWFKENKNIELDDSLIVYNENFAYIENDDILIENLEMMDEVNENDLNNQIDIPAVLYNNGNVRTFFLNDGIKLIDYNDTMIENYEDDSKEWWINGIKKDRDWVKKYLILRKRHLLSGVMVSDYWKIREIILRWRYNPVLKCVQARLKREFESLIE